MTDDRLVDNKGIVHDRSFTGEWKPRQGIFGPEKDTNWLGNPNTKRNIIGEPSEARGFFGQPVKSNSGNQLYQPSSSGGGSSGGSEALAGLVGILILGIFILSFIVIAALFKVLHEIINALVSGWLQLVHAYPRAMLVVHLLLGMSVVYSLLWLAEFSTALSLGGATLVPALWGWVWLTRRLPLVLMPINAVLAGSGLWWASDITRESWESTWLRVTAGIPLLGHLPYVVAILPLVVWFWSLGMRRWPREFVAPNLIVTGAALWFILLRVWTDWVLYWDRTFLPVPFMPSSGLIILIAPLVVWGWLYGQQKWPLPLFVVNIMIFGGVLALSSWHTQPSWNHAWIQWTDGIPGSGHPIIIIGLAPISVWAWGQASQWRQNLFVVPNLIIVGAIGWLVLDRTRNLWHENWLQARGDVHLTPDPAIIALVLPSAYWAWSQGRQRWPDYWIVARAALIGVLAWWVVERTREAWQEDWLSFAGNYALDPALFALFSPMAVLGWMKLRDRWPHYMFIAGWILVVPLLGWFVARVLPSASFLLVFLVAFSPPAAWGWSRLLQRYRRLGWALTLIPLVCIALLFFVAPSLVEAFGAAVGAWLADQGISAP